MPASRSSRCSFLSFRSALVGDRLLFSRSYAERLLPLIRAARLDRLLAEVRHAYRLGAEAKLHYFARR
jgi:hypothetical protein